MAGQEIYVRFYSGHKGMHGHEFLEFEIKPDGRLRYANNSNYKSDTMIRKEVTLSAPVLAELARIVSESGILSQDDANWPLPDKSGNQELEVIYGGDHISFSTCKLSSMMQVGSSKDPEGLGIFYYLIQDLKTLVFDLISLHFKVKPI